MPIPPEIAAKALFRSDRTCCVCRMRGKPVQIHHIDGNNRNNKLENLAVLCLDCHAETQVVGGFHRKVDAEQVILYRNDWENIVQRERTKFTIDLYAKETERRTGIEVLTSIAEIFRENEQYELLAMHYHSIGNAELRDKYVEKTLSKSPTPQTIVFLRGLQNRADLIPEEIINEEIERRTKNKDWSQLARLFVTIKRWNEAVYYYCKEIIKAVQEGNVFTAAYYLKEMSLGEKLQNKLFENAYSQATRERNLWWQIRALQELGWDSELDELLKAHKVEIERSDDNYMMALLYKTIGDRRRYAETLKKMYKGAKIVVFGKKENRQE